MERLTDALILWLSFYGYSASVNATNGANLVSLISYSFPTEARKRIRDAIACKSSAAASQRLMTSSTWSSSSKAFAPSGECVMETRHVIRDGVGGFEADVSDNEDAGET